METWICTFCKEEFQRYRSHVTNANRHYCSMKCRVESQKIPEADKRPKKKYKKPTTYCQCGNQKDYRAKRCSKCARTSFPKDKEPYIQLSALIEVTAKSRSYLEAANMLGISRQTITRAIQQNNLDISHFRRGRNRPFESDKILIILDERKNAPVKRCLIENNLLDYKCVICNQEPTWQNKPLTLELDHINGDPCDNRIENLRFLCPNCHRQTTTNKGKNMLKARRRNECHDD